MISVYLDESRHENQSTFMVLAGFYGNKEQWESFAPNWVSSLGRRKSLHMRGLRLNSPRGAKRAKPLLLRLGEIPYKHGLSPVYSAVKSGDYSDIIKDTPLEKRLPGYAVCLISVMQRLSKVIPAHESIKLICEIQTRYETVALQTFKEASLGLPLKNPDRPYFSGIEFISKSELTQPSVFLAYALAEAHENEKSGKARICRPIFGPTGQILGKTLTREEIRQVITNARIQMRDGYRTAKP